MPTRINAADTVPRINDYSLLGLVQSIEYTPNLNAQDIFELGNSAKVDTALEMDLTGSIELIDAGQLPGILARMVVSRNASQVFTGYLFASAGAFGKNGYTITEQDMDEMIFDLLIHEKTDQTNFNRTLVIPRAFLTSINGRADANGISSATLNFASDYMMGLDSPYHDAFSRFATRTTNLTATVSNIQNLTNTTAIFFWVNERRFDTDSAKATYVSTWVPGTGVITLITTESYVIPADAMMRIVVYKSTSPSTTFLSVNSGEQGTSAFYLKGYQTSIYLAPATASAPTATEQWLKVQTLDWTMDFKNSVLKQLAFNTLGSSVYFRGANYPFDVSATATVNENDWTDWHRVQTRSFPGNSLYQDINDLSPAFLKGSFNLVVIQYTRTGNKLCEWRFSDMRLDGRSDTYRVGEIETVNWTLKGTRYTTIGYNN